MRMTSYQTGLFAEFIARMYLRIHGFRILKSRYITGRNTGRAEIDIIARRKNLLVFIEVKSRPDLLTGMYAITAPQMRRLQSAAETYIIQNKWTGDARFDAIIVARGRIRHIRGAF